MISKTQSEEIRGNVKTVVCADITRGYPIQRMVKLAGEIGYETHRKQKLTLNSVWSIAPPYGTIPIGTF